MLGSLQIGPEPFSWSAWPQPQDLRTRRLPPNPRRHLFRTQYQRQDQQQHQQARPPQVSPGKRTRSSAAAADEDVASPEVSVHESPCEPLTKLDGGRCHYMPTGQEQCDGKGPDAQRKVNVPHNEGACHGRGTQHASGVSVVTAQSEQAGAPAENKEAW